MTWNSPGPLPGAFPPPSPRPPLAPKAQKKIPGSRGSFFCGFSQPMGSKSAAPCLHRGADEVVGQGVPLVDVAADLAHEALLPLGLGLGLHVLLVVGVGHGGLVADDPGLGHGADEHAVGAQVHILLHLQGQEGVDILGEEGQAVVGPVGLPVGRICPPGGRSGSRSSQTGRRGRPPTRR